MKKILLSLTLVTLLAACKKSDRNNGTSSDGPIDDRNTGRAANALLSAGTYTSLQVEISYMPGYAPDAGALSRLNTFLQARLNKPGGITVTTRAIPAASNAVLSVSDLAAIEGANRTARSSGSTATIHILYTNGSYTESNVLGVAYRGTAVALFGKKIHDNSGGVGQASRTKLEATVLEHEIGHLLGLVDIGTPMQTPHKDPGGSAHCNNQNCLMYYAAETTDILGLLVTGSVPSLDAACINDLRGNGGR
ncbi:M12 family metallo-peptidase [Flaviaesturariibacter amylovorans]|uniref:Peptidase n=1 Tax=Flaviaesturariibacter amylovorans TaxID=1084520 RepID=A0ABP8GH60_9BACT